MSEYNEFKIEEDMIMEYYGNGGNVVIPDGIKDIFFQAFYEIDNITSLTIPGSIIDITPFVFEHCSSLKEVILKHGIKVIGVNSFNYCNNIEIVKLPLSIERIQQGAFSNCKSLKEI